MLLISRVSFEHGLATQVGKLLSLRHGTLRSIVRGGVPGAVRVNHRDLCNTAFLIVQYLYEKAESMPRKEWRRARRLEADASEITRLFNESSLIPGRRSKLDGPTGVLTAAAKVTGGDRGRG